MNPELRTALAEARTLYSLSRAKAREIIAPQLAAIPGLMKAAASRNELSFEVDFHAGKPHRSFASCDYSPAIRIFVDAVEEMGFVVVGGSNTNVIVDFSRLLRGSY